MSQQPDDAPWRAASEDMFDEDDYVPSTPTLPSNMQPSSALSGSSASPLGLSVQAGELQLLPNAPAPTANIVNAKLKKGKQLGAGSFGVVFQAMDVETGALVAVKQIRLPSDAPSSSGIVKSVQREVDIMARLPSHPNCVKYLGSKKSERHVSIFMEYVSGGTIETLLKQYGAFTEATMRRYAQMILEGLLHLHSNGIIHQDIKGGNVLVDEQGRVAKIADFGCCKDLAKMTCSLRTAGTPLWMAPEVCSQGKADYRSDVWSFGCLLLEMVKDDHLPWSNFSSSTSIYAVMYAIASAKEPPEIPSHLSDAARRFIRRCLVIDSTQRASVYELLQDAFLMVPLSVSANPLSQRAPQSTFDNTSPFSSNNSTFVTDHSTPPQKNLLVSDDSLSPTVAVGQAQQHLGTSASPTQDPKRVVFQSTGKGTVKDDGLFVCEEIAPAHSSPVSGGRKALGRKEEGIFDKLGRLFGSDK